MFSSAATLATSVLARAGSGSSGFSGGGGFGGGGGRSSGGSGGGLILVGGGGGGGGLLLIVFLVILLLVVVPIAMTGWKRHQRARARDARDAEVRTAAAAAAADDEAFDADRLIADTAAMAVAIQDAWDDQDTKRLATMVGDDLLQEWTLRLQDFARRGWADRVKVTGQPTIRLASVTNRAEDADDRVVVHVTLPMENWVDTRFGPQFPNGQEDATTTLSEYWTLGKRNGRWILVSIEQEEEGHHHLSATLVTDPSEDPELAARARTELAIGDTAGASVGELVGLASTGFSDDARAAALDLSLVDDRFSPDVLQIAVDRAVAAWATAIDGSDDDLERLADPAAVRALLYGADTTQRTRTVVRGPRLQDVTIERVVGSAADEQQAVATATAAMHVAVHYRARWYREDRETAAVIEGSPTRESERTDHWEFRLTDDAEHPWRLVAAAV